MNFGSVFEDVSFTAIVIIIGIIYLLVRDLIGIFREKKKKKAYKEDLIQSEKRIHTMMQNLDSNRQGLINDLQKLKGSVEKAADDISDQIKEKKKKSK